MFIFKQNIEICQNIFDHFSPKELISTQGNLFRNGTSVMLNTKKEIDGGMGFNFFKAEYLGIKLIRENE